MRCPRCGSTRVSTHIVQDSNVETKRKGFGWCWAIIGFLVAWPLALCGLCGMGKEKTTVKTINRSIHICQDCGKEF